MRNLFFGLLLAGCAGRVDIDPEVIAPADDSSLAIEEVTEEPCGMAFDPDPELLEATLSAAERWSAATGCDVRVEEEGIRLVVLPEVFDNSGKPTRARTTTIWIDGVLRTDRIEYRADSLDQADRIVPHELGHALGGYGHTDGGLMRETPKLGDIIEVSSLNLVCERFECEEFTPELSTTP